MSPSDVTARSCVSQQPGGSPSIESNQTSGALCDEEIQRLVGVTIAKGSVQLLLPEEALIMCLLIFQLEETVLNGLASQVALR